MAVAVASVATTTMASVASSFTITKPTGLAVGDGLVAVVCSLSPSNPTISTPSGWTLESSGATALGSNSSNLYTFSKVADSGDVAASNFSFSVSSTCDAGGVLIRTTGSRTDDLVIGSEYDSISDTSDPTFTIAQTPSQNNVVLVVAYLNGAAKTSSISSVTINGTNPTWTNRYNSDGPTYDSNFQVFTAPVATTAAITTLDQTVSPTSSSRDWASILGVIGGQNDASTTVGFASSTQTAFAPTGSAGAQTTVGFTSSTQTAFTPTGLGNSPSQYTNPTKSTTTWTNPDKP